MDLLDKTNIYGSEVSHNSRGANIPRSLQLKI
jgi:hypothetical protein